jgi:hypothetical protein
MSTSNESWHTDGYFWLAGSEDDPIPGVLTRSEAGDFELALNGILGSPDAGFAPPVQARIPAIYGQTKKFPFLVLLGSLEENRSFNFGAVNTPESKISANRILTGSCPHEFDKAPLHKIRSVVPGLDAWLGVSGIEYQLVPDGNPIRATYMMPEPITFPIDDGIEVAFSFGREGPKIGRTVFEVSIKQLVYLEIRVNRPRSLEEMLQIQQQVVDLISFAVGVPLTIVSMDGKYAIPSIAPNGQWARVWIEYPGIDEEIPIPERMVFTFREVRENFGEMLKAWRNMVQAVEPTYQLYFATIRSSVMYAEHRLFNLFQALETYHRRAVGEDSEAKKKLISLRDKIIDSVPVVDRDWLKAKLAFCHEPTASERIKQLASLLNAQWIFGSDHDSVIQRITNVRNYLTHYSKKPPDEDLRSVRMMNFAAKLQVLCEDAFLHRLGLASERANGILRAKHRLESISFDES